MSWIRRAVKRLAAEPCCGYRAEQAPYSEPTALAALALTAHGQLDSAGRGLAWLANAQNPDGSVGPSATQRAPAWPTALAILAWASGARAYDDNVKRAVHWALAFAGRAYPRHKEMGHDPSIPGWPWVAGTHAWVEPTAWHLIALKQTGHGVHPRAREARRLLMDRLLPEGGCNYGNTSVLGQYLRPHIAPTGLTLVALAREADTTGQIQRSRDYLARTLSAATPTISLGYGLLGLAAQGDTPSESPRWLEAAFDRVALTHESWKLALLLLAARADDCPLLSPLDKVAAQ